MGNGVLPEREVWRQNGFGGAHLSDANPFNISSGPQDKRFIRQCESTNHRPRSSANPIGIASTPIPFDTLFEADVGKRATVQLQPVMENDEGHPPENRSPSGRSDFPQFPASGANHQSGSPSDRERRRRVSLSMGNISLSEW